MSNHYRDPGMVDRTFLRFSLEQGQAFSTSAESLGHTPSRTSRELARQAPVEREVAMAADLLLAACRCQVPRGQSSVDRIT
jgi:hypothetical protein